MPEVCVAMGGTGKNCGPTETVGLAEGDFHKTSHVQHGECR